VWSSTGPGSWSDWRRDRLRHARHRRLDAAPHGLDQLGLDEETTRLFLYENAKRVFKLGL
jgi:hypothetical protein